MTAVKDFPPFSTENPAVVRKQHSPWVHISNHQNLLFLSSHVFHGCDGVRVSRLPLFLHWFSFSSPDTGCVAFIFLLLYIHGAARTE